MAIRVPCLCFLMFSFVINVVNGRTLRLNVSEDLISDGVDAISTRPPLLNIVCYSPRLTKCVHIYGFFPCADNIGGYIFQIVVYQYLLIIGGKLILRGSKILFNIIGTGVYGATLFRILTVLPKMAMVIVSGVLNSKENAQTKVSFGVGVYAGSTVFNLTLLWGICVIYGRKELSAMSKCFEAKEKLSQLKDTGTIVDKKTCYTAGIMLVSLIPYIIVQLTYFPNTLFGTRIVILIALIVSTALLLSYFIYQIYDPWIQQRSLEYSKYENLLAGFLQHVQRHAKEKLVDENGQPNIPVIKGLFCQTDKDADKCITFLELENLIREIQSGKMQVEKDYAISEILKAFDLNSDRRIEEHEFVEGCTKWIHEAKQLAENGDSTSRTFIREAKDFDTDGDSIIDEQEFADGIMWGEVDNLVYEVGQNESTKFKLLRWDFSKSILQVILGLAILTFLSEPLMNSIQQFSDAIGVPSFFISFVIVPVAINARSAILAIFPASQKSSRTSSLTFSEIYGGVVMNNMMGLSTLLAIVYIKDLKWDYSAEVLTILVE
ncbi:hypothetical protein BUALT_Bualt03G0049500 [Buddleja alternifolia]|uniref:EF-hand domain-containing protein n=1 Tax=Buddleja alternifolia TaxID=168488 RepID=A0AAV6Y1Z6_9LAMI|nr:hypothetical protein BUALT_Bualt03G0049500 [Buddleja alternifolia]